MKILKFAAFFLITFLSAQLMADPAYTVENVKVNVTANSAAEAREQAIQQGYSEAYHKLMSQLEQAGMPTRADVPNAQDLMDMVSGFSVNREKYTTNSYSALMTFQFQPEKVKGWISGTQTNKNPSGATGDITAFISLSDIHELNKKTQEILNISGVHRVELRQLTTRGALIVIHTGSTADELVNMAHQKNIHLVIQP